MLRIAICDDDRYFLNKFQTSLYQFFKSKAEIIDCFTNPNDLLNSESHYNLLFLDIEMPQMNGIDLARHYSREDAVIVFVTNRDTLVYDAYNSTDSYGFIRKSNIKSDFLSIVRKLQNTAFSPASLSIKSGANIISVKYKEIIYIEKLVNNVIIHTVRGNYTERNTISNLEKQLSNHCFVRCHIGYLVNLDYITLINSTEITLKNSEKIPLSRRNVKIVKSMFLKRSGSLIE